MLKGRLYEVRGEESTFEAAADDGVLLAVGLPAARAGDRCAVIGRGTRPVRRRGVRPWPIAGVVDWAGRYFRPARATDARCGRGVAMDELVLAEPALRLDGHAQRRAPDPTSWDFASNHEQDLLLVVELKDGSRVAGYYGKRSHSGYGTRTRDLFLAERWTCPRMTDRSAALRPSAIASAYGSTLTRSVLSTTTL